MCALIAMAVYDTEENKRTDYTRRTLESLLDTVDFNRHRLIISDNGSCKATHQVYQNQIKAFSKFPAGAGTVIYNNENLGTAEAINKAWFHRKAGENAIKLDNDIVIHCKGWVEEMEEAIARDPLIGIIGLKRIDLCQTPWHPDPNYRSELIMLPQEAGQRWIVVERTNDIIGTCTMFNSALLDKVGYSIQPGKYGYEDVLFSHRSHIAGFYNCFLPHIKIDHIDAGGDDYGRWKERHAGEYTEKMIAIFKGYYDNPESIYYNPFA